MNSKSIDYKSTIILTAISIEFEYLLHNNQTILNEGTNCHWNSNILKKKKMFCDVRNNWFGKKSYLGGMWGTGGWCRVYGSQMQCKNEIWR